MTRKAWIRVLGAGALLTLAAAVAVRVSGPGGFDAARWQAQRGSDARDNPRSFMVSDLIRRLRPGMTSEEVTALLGAPESQTDARYVYDLGASPYGIDYEYFVVEFDAAGRLVRHAITRG